ncbi:MAG: 5-guanidino-2-oxopentanoate decarboxylase [Actinobacteria bacterium]|nr:5-guanidino-2-oxopentanoate decarboxylase [Actinomycetota bacterium]
MRLGEAVIDLLVREYGVDTVFGIPGVHNIELYRGLHRSGVRAVSPRHEQGAGFMADGWSVVTGRPGVCTLISGPGLTNALTPMAQAFHDSRPMLVLAATTPTDALGRRLGPLHDLDDQAAVARTVTAFSETVLHPDEVPELLAMAFEVFSSSRPRPVHLAFPTDVLEMEVEPLQPFVGAATRPAPSPSAVEAAVALLGSATSPVIIAGGGAIDAGTELRHLAEVLDAPVVLTGNAKGVLASSHPLCAGNVLVVPAVQSALEAADVVLVVGSEVSDADLYNGGRALEFSGVVVRIDIDPDQLDRRMQPDVRIVSDSSAALAALAHHLRRRSTDGAVRAARLRSAASAGTPEHLVSWIEAIQQALPHDVIVALDSTQLAYSAHVRLSAEHPRSWLAPYGMGTLGCALPMAIGAAIGAPDRPVFALAGDGGWLFTVAEMATAVDEGLNLVLVVWDNRGYAQIRQSFDDAHAPRMGVDVSSVDPVGIAAGFGWSTTTVHHPDALQVAMTAAFATGGPQFIRVVVPD